jgi:hypothetical protein
LWRRVGLRRLLLLLLRRIACFRLGLSSVSCSSGGWWRADAAEEDCHVCEQLVGLPDSVLQALDTSQEKLPETMLTNML